MADQLLEAARLEVHTLLPQLREDPRFRRYEIAQRVIRELTAIPPIPVADQATHLTPPPSPALPVLVRRRPLSSPPEIRPPSRTAAVIATAKEYLASTGKRAPSPLLLQIMTARGIEFPEGNEVETLSSILSANDAFDNVRGQGYGLVEWAAHAGAPASERLGSPPATTLDPSSSGLVDWEKIGQAESSGQAGTGGLVA